MIRESLSEEVTFGLREPARGIAGANALGMAVWASFHCVPRAVKSSELFHAGSDKI